MAVQKLNHLSDHRPILLKLLLQNMTENSNNTEEQVKLFNAPERYLIDNDSVKNFENALETDTSVFSDDSEGNTKNIGNLLKQIMNKFENAAKTTLETKTSGKQKKVRHKNWCTKNCQEIRRELRTIMEAFNRCPNNPYFRGKYFTLKKKYKSTCKREKKKYEQEILNRLEHSKSHNPNEFWKLLKQLNYENKTKPTDTPSITEFYEHYKSLLQNQPNPENNIINENVPLPELESLNEKISIEEIENSLKNLKDKKIPGLDNLNPEMIKCVKGELLRDILKLFNEILETGKYPKKWNQGLIFSIYKNGSTKNPANYRGITLTSCLGKLFGYVLYN